MSPLSRATCCAARSRLGTSWASAHRACAQRCLSCERCRFISVSIRWRDCSWFSACDTSRLLEDIPDFRTFEVRPSLPPPPPFAALQSSGRHGEPLVTLPPNMSAIQGAACWAPHCGDCFGFGPAHPMPSPTPERDPRDSAVSLAPLRTAPVAYELAALAHVTAGARAHARVISSCAAAIDGTSRCRSRRRGVSWCCCHPPRHQLGTAPHSSASPLWKDGRYFRYFRYYRYYRYCGRTAAPAIAPSGTRRAACCECLLRVDRS